MWVHCVQLEMGNQIFDGVANLLYDCLDWRRQHQHYLNNLKLLNVPTVVGSHQHPAEVHLYMHVIQ